MFSKLITIFVLFRVIDIANCKKSKSFEFISESKEVNFSNWSPNEFLYVDIPNRIVVEGYGHAFLEDGYYFMPWIIIWKHNDDFPLLAKHNDTYSNKFSKQGRKKRASVEMEKDMLSPKKDFHSNLCNKPGQVIKIPEYVCCTIYPITPLSGPIYFESNCTNNTTKIIRKKRFFLDALAISMSSVALGMSMYNTAEIATIKESMNDIDKNFDVVKDFMKSSNKKFETVLNNERLMLLKIQKTESTLRKYFDTKMEKLEEGLKPILNNLSNTLHTQINELHEEIWEICLINGRLIPDLLSKEEVISILDKVDPKNETVYRHDLEAFYLLF